MHDWRIDPGPGGYWLAVVLTSCGFRRKKYENPITKDTQQPDKVLFDKAIKDIEKGRYEVARLTLNTLINTYDTSEFLAKAKLAIADSWFREGGSHGLAQAEAEYKDFILFYPTLEEAAEAQEKVCMIHFKQMEKADRDVTACPARRGRVPPVAGPVPQQQVRPARAAAAARDPGSDRRARIPRRHLLSHQGQLPGRRQPPADAGRPLSALQQGRRRAVATGRFLLADGPALPRHAAARPMRAS